MLGFFYFVTLCTGLPLLARAHNGLATMPFAGFASLVKQCAAGSPAPRVALFGLITLFCATGN